MDNNWKDNPKLKEISPEKLEILENIVGESRAKSAKELIPFFLAASKEANSRGINFSDSETSIILDVLKQDMTEEEISKIETIKKLAKMISGKRK